LVKHGKYRNHFFGRSFGNVLLGWVDGLSQTSYRKGLVPALITLVLMALITERGLSSTTRKPVAVKSRVATADYVAPVFMDSL
jgi:hypothetical protein